MTTLPDPVEEFERRFPEVAEAFRKVDAELREALFKTVTSQADEREDIYRSVRALEKARAKIMTALTDKHLKAVSEERAATLANTGAATA